MGEASGAPPEKVAKLNYRIKHLVRSLETEEKEKVRMGIKPGEQNQGAVR